MMDLIDEHIPVIALTATATPKVQSDIIKNLGLRKPKIFISSFNRPNLYYEIQPKINLEQTNKSIALSVSYDCENSIFMSSCQVPMFLTNNLLCGNKYADYANRECVKCSYISLY